MKPNWKNIYRTTNSPQMPQVQKATKPSSGLTVAGKGHPKSG